MPEVFQLASDPPFRPLSFCFCECFDRRFVAGDFCGPLIGQKKGGGWQLGGGETENRASARDSASILAASSATPPLFLYSPHAHTRTHTLRTPTALLFFRHSLIHIPLSPSVLIVPHYLSFRIS
jgi:hypothetical protein